MLPLTANPNVRDCLWPSEVFHLWQKKFKSQAMCTFQFMYEHTVVKTRFLSYEYYKGLKQQKWPSASLKDSGYRAIR